MTMPTQVLVLGTFWGDQVFLVPAGGAKLIIVTSGIVKDEAASCPVLEDLLKLRQL